jgi:uncharacterized membrane-anchored protein
MVFMAFANSPSDHSEEMFCLRKLAHAYRLPFPAEGPTHCLLECGSFSVTYERHSEFSRLLISAPRESKRSLTENSSASEILSQLPDGWLQSFPGKLISAMEIVYVNLEGTDPNKAQALFENHTIVGGSIAGGSAIAFTDFVVKPDGFTRLLLLNRNLGERQAGRTVQRLFELEAYRMMALLALPVAQEIKPELVALEQALVEISADLTKTTSAKEEEALFNRLTALEVEIESMITRTQYRFSAAVAYSALVHARLEELREERMSAIQTFKEFIDRRFAPAMATCQAAASRQAQISERAARVTQLLTARVNLSREQQNQVLLESMNRRAGIQLRMQQAVEGFSVAAITYYGTGLLGYFVKAARTLGLPVEPDLFMAFSVPVVAVLAYFAVHRVQKRLRPRSFES